jgi:O-acetyl-ADP-ribose deacetylase (regulator of RNase III)
LFNLNGVPPVRSIEKRGKEVRKRLAEAEAELSSILIANPTMTTQYLEVQWNRQREIQKKVISESAQEKRAQLLVYMEFEEELVEAR